MCDPDFGVPANPNPSRPRSDCSVAAAGTRQRRDHVYQIPLAVNTVAVALLIGARCFSPRPLSLDRRAQTRLAVNLLARQRRAGEQVGATEARRRRPRRCSLDEQRGGRAQVVLVGPVVLVAHTPAPIRHSGEVVIARAPSLKRRPVGVASATITRR